MKNRGIWATRGLVAVAVVAASAAFAAETLVGSGVLSSYEGLAPAHTMQTQALWRGDPEALAAAKTARIAPVKVAPAAAGKTTAAARALIANELARTLCARLGSRFQMVSFRSPADVTVRATITGIRETGIAAASASMGIGVVARVVGSPVAPRAPFGLGGLSAEAEAMDRSGAQRAALVWKRGANALLTRARVSHIGDAYQLAAAFANDLAKLVVTGRDPLSEASLPHMLRKTPPKACAIYGRGEKSGYLNGTFGLAPEATDEDAPVGRKGASKKDASPRD